ncbi:MAG: YceI family protein [Deinococcales bacterium]|nr:YceI family protein [Chitinophagaceae bacterium]
MKQLLFTFLFVCCITVVFAQKIYQTKSGKISFYSAALLENIEAINNQVDSKLSNNGQLVFMVAIKGFRFENATMQEHFNENYMDSDKYPKAVFQGKISNLGDVNFDKNGSYITTITGVLNMHGVKQPVTALGTIEVKAGKVAAKSSFKVKLADYNIKGNLIGDKIAKELTITVDCKYD